MVCLQRKLLSFCRIPHSKASDLDRRDSHRSAALRQRCCIERVWDGIRLVSEDEHEQFFQLQSCWRRYFRRYYKWTKSEELPSAVVPEVLSSAFFIWPTTWFISSRMRTQLSPIPIWRRFTLNLKRAVEQDYLNSQVHRSFKQQRIPKILCSANAKNIDVVNKKNSCDEGFNHGKNQNRARAALQGKDCLDEAVGRCTAFMSRQGHHLQVILYGNGFMHLQRWKGPRNIFKSNLTGQQTLRANAGVSDLRSGGWVI